MAEIGSTLRESRMRARIDISEVENATKIRAKYLRAIENEEWDLLPGPVYIKSFLRTYGDFLGLDSRLLIDEFKRRYERPADSELRAIASTARERDRRRSTPGALSRLLLSPRSVIGVALLVIVAALYVIGSHSLGKSLRTGSPITPATTGGSSPHRHQPRHHRHAAAGTGSRKHTSTGTATTATPAGQPSTTTGTGTTPAGTTDASLTIVPTATVWICVVSQSGTPLITATDYSPGQTIPTLSAPEILVTLGNTSATLTADGKPYPVSGGQVTNLKITPQGVTTSATVASCG